jgi:UDP:flavonoid glycosyltransferase YjiC (YdhE family)
MEPFLALGQGLVQRGHAVICAFPDQFEYLAGEAGLEFVSLGSEFIDLLDSDLGRAALGGGGPALSKFVANVRLAGRQKEVNRALVERQREITEIREPDRILYNGKAIYPLLRELAHPGSTVLISPVPYLHYVEGHTHLAFHTNLGALLNSFTYRLADFGQAVTARISARWLSYSKPPALRRLRQVLAARRVVYTISPTLFPPPPYWERNIQVLGYPERTEYVDWHPDEALQQFLDRHAEGEILFATFGSMTNPEPEKRTEALVEVLLRHRIPAIINTAAGGLVSPGDLQTDLIHFVSEVPYEHIFQRVHAVLQHGGSGTTHMALRAGCPTMIVPHIIDQFAWGRIVEDLGAGPAALPIRKFTAKRLEPGILALFGTSSYRRRAQEIAASMAAEDFREELYAQLVQ